MNKTKRRFLSILLSLALMLGLMSGMTLTAYADNYDWDWNENKHFTEDAEYNLFVMTDKSIQVTIDEGKTVLLNEGIQVSGTLIVKGKGKLIVKGSDGDFEGDGGDTGFFGNLLVDGPEVTITGGNGADASDPSADSPEDGGHGGEGLIGNVIVKSGSVSVTGGQGGHGNQYSDNGGNGISGSLIMNGGSATVNGGQGGWGWNDGSYSILYNVIVRSGSAVLTAGNWGSAVLGRITGDAEESENNSDWKPVSDNESYERYVKVTGNVPVIEYPLWVSGVQVTNYNQDDVLDDDPVNCGKVSYTPAAGTTPAALTLNNANITKGYPDTLEESGIYYNGADALEIVLAEGSDNIIAKSEGDFKYCGIYSADTNAAVTISGTGKLTAKGSDNGIKATNNLTINGGNVSAIGAGSGINAANDVTIKGGTVNATATYDGGSHGIIGRKNVTIEGGDVTAYATGSESDGIKAYEGIVNISGGNVIASGKTQAIVGNLKNSIAGTGWTNTEGTTGRADIAGSTTGQDLSSYKKVQFPAVYPLWVGDTQVTSVNATDTEGTRGWSYTPAVADDPATDKDETTPATLTLSGLTLTSCHGTGNSASGIYCEEPLNIVLAANTENNVSPSGSVYGIYSEKSITISGDGSLTATQSQSSGATGIYVKGLTIKGGTIDVSGYYGIYSPSPNLISIEGGALTASGTGKAISGTVKNSISGTGWSDKAGTEGQTSIAISTEGQDLSSYKKVVFLPHQHSFTYVADGATITATCANTDGKCPLDDGTEEHKHTATLTIAAPTLTTYGQTGEGISAEATITDENSIQGDAKVQYQKKTGGSYGAATETAPSDAGDYKASITVSGATASVEYTIAKADPTANAPTGLTATYGQTLADVTLTNPTGNTAGTWAWADSTQSVGNVVSPAATFKANFTPTDTANYNSVSNVDVTVTVNKADNPATVTDTASVTKGGKTVDLADNVTLNDATGNVSYAFSGDAKGCSLSGSVLTSGDTAGTVTVNVTVAADDNYKALAATLITVTINNKQAQTITADDVTVTYGDTGKSITATADGGGALSYAVKSGDAVTVNETTGALTILKAGSAVITVTAAETDTYAEATKDVNVTVNQAAASVNTVPAAKTLTYTGSAQELLNSGEATGGTMQYALGADAANAPTTGWSTSMPSKTDAGTYYVWYKVVADANHIDTDPDYTTATISKKAVTVKAADQSVREGYDIATGVDYASLIGACTGHSLNTVTLTQNTEDGIITPSFATIKDAGGNNVTNNYSISYTDGNLTIFAKIVVEVTFTVENGSWNDGTTADKTVTLSRFEDENKALVLEATDIPEAGNYPDETYKAGSWDTVPSTETAFTEDTTYTYTYAQQDIISATITFKVVNGSWNDGTTANKTVTLWRYENENKALVLAEDQIPAVGSRPGAGYKAGSWNKVPRTETIFTEDTTYTYTYEKQDTVSETVTFKVVNGAWDDGTTDDKIVTLSRLEGENKMLSLAADQIPAVGNKPYENYTEGSWDFTPQAGMVITQDTTFTYTYTKKAVRYFNEWVNGKWYDKNGNQTYKPLGDWKMDGKYRMYVDTSGWYPKNRWQKIDFKWYFFDREGHMLKDAYQKGADGRIWYVGKNGVWDGKDAVIGWKQDSKGWKFFRYGEDYLKNTWKMINGNWYYFKADGYAAQNEFINGWWLSDNCAWIYHYRSSWHKNSHGWWYGDETGWYAGKTLKSYTIDGTKRNFNKGGYCTNP